MWCCGFRGGGSFRGLLGIGVLILAHAGLWLVVRFHINSRGSSGRRKGSIPRPSSAAGAGASGLGNAAAPPPGDRPGVTWSSARRPSRRLPPLQHPDQPPHRSQNLLLGPLLPGQNRSNCQLLEVAIFPASVPASTPEPARNSIGGRVRGKGVGEIPGSGGDANSVGVRALRRVSLESDLNCKPFAPALGGILLGLLIDPWVIALLVALEAAQAARIARGRAPRGKGRIGGAGAQVAKATSGSPRSRAAPPMQEPERR